MKINAIKNITSNEFIFKASANSFAEVTGIEKRAIVFQIPTAKINWNAMYLLTGSVQVAEKDANFEFTGKLRCLEDLGDSLRIEFDLLQYDRTLWLQFLQQIQFKQIKADQIFRSIKGDS